MTKYYLPLALAAAMALPAFTAAQAQNQPPQRIVVTGEGEKSVAPDLALLSLSVMREAKTAREALDANNDAMAAVIAAMKAAGIEDRDMQTSGIQIIPRYNYNNKPDGSQEAQLIAYQVTNTLSVRVRDLAKAGDILDKSVSLGVNQGGGITFTNNDPSAALTEARKMAVKNAIDKAKVLSEAAGVQLGRVLEISDQTFQPRPMPMAKSVAYDSAGAVPVQAGENSYNVQVNVTFEIK
ncbi:SIMPL domain-containing protein [Pseudaminobacter soli (ex Li et al. 2025)]|uniref:SIMPL domain-containing protein n=1 Tax=Pseudaminobacter soli (ex Li et al. 2025) TaxID=1295366 RepID=A0A2P7SMC9_9HYPH|nr:SIMPL domain-containing protein [Mesorhizobium soli]PSJ63561.1 hypothetical protein C7I85_00005 [Mesorhizobium soli]